jgi:hypothetical protein
MADRFRQLPIRGSAHLVPSYMLVFSEFTYLREHNYTQLKLGQGCLLPCPAPLW